MRYDVLIAGAGMTGAAAARTLVEVGLRVCVAEERDHIGGNCHDRPDEHGVLIHPYGPHIFHSSSRAAIDFLSRFTGWRAYEHRVTALVRDRIIPVPFNLTSLAVCFPAQEARRMEEALVKRYGRGGQAPVLELLESGDACLRDLARFVYEELFLGYTQKQWGLAPTELDPQVTARVPVRVSHDDRYFQDAFQHMPDAGFARMFDRMLDHPGITLRLGTSFAQVEEPFRAAIHTGTIDGYFHHRLGALPYRSLDFDFQRYKQPRHLPSAVMNHPSIATAWTRITEYKQLTGQEHPHTSVSLEYPRPHEPGRTIPYYPVFTDDAARLYADYRDLAAREAPGVIFAGRLGAFRYLNMDDAALAGIEAARQATILLNAWTGAGRP
ncbi:MAG: UDP-galactopyranose mutase [Deltaproteobacteria bacterium]|nr:UDP-galactopyranose mutase [Deltaproteobacteria bacterium]